ncbi:MAG: hypothetical protein HQ579_05370 [Candidatus Omnitrophica bacterium]|nr:hypothetical protein [Candidatus Omnitrophota bacterium]
MELFNDLYILTVKNKQLIPTGVLLVLGMITGRRIEKAEDEAANYLGDNVPLDLAERIRRA